MNGELLPLCQNLQKLRREKGLSQSNASKELGLSQVLLSHYENGARKPSLEFILRACDYYAVSADYLLGRSGVRDGSSPEAEENGGEDDKRLVGMASVKLGQTILISGLRVLYHLLGSLGHAALVSEVTAFLGSALARMFFRLCRASGYEEDYFPGGVHETASFMDLAACDLRVARSLTLLREKGQEMPDLNYQKLDAQYLQQFKALATLAHQSTERIRKQI